MSFEGFKFTPESQGEKIEEVPVLNLENGDWSLDHDDTIAGVHQTESGQQVEIRFFENKIPSIKVDRDETLRVIRSS